MQNCSAKLIAAAAAKNKQTYVPKTKKIRSQHVKNLDKARSKKMYHRKKEERDFFCHLCHHKSASEKCFVVHYIRVHDINKSILETDAWKEHLRGTIRE